MKKLSNEAKTILNELMKADDLRSVPRDRFDRPVPTAKPASPSKGAVDAFYKCADQCHFGWIIQDNLLEKFKSYAEAKQVNDHIVDPTEKDFNAVAYENDMAAHAEKLANEQEFLKYAKENPGMYSFQDVSHHIRQFNSLRANFPSKLDAKYLKDKIITITNSGTQCLERFLELDTLRNEIRVKHTASQLAQWHKDHDLTMDEEDFKLCKQLFNLGQLDVSKVPIEMIKTNCHWVTVRDNLSDALWHHNSVAAYNADENKFSMDSKPADDEFAASAFNDNDAFILNALIAMMNEFQNVERIENSLNECLN